MVSPEQHIIKLGFGFVVSQALCVVADLKIADRLAAGERSVNDLAEDTGSHPDALYPVMRLLAADGVFHETAARRFGLTEVGAALRSEGRSSPRDLIRMLNREPYLAFALPAFDEVFGKPRFDWLAEHPDEAALFQRAMIALSQALLSETVNHKQSHDGIPFMGPGPKARPEARAVGLRDLWFLTCREQAARLPASRVLKAYSSRGRCRGFQEVRSRTQIGRRVALIVFDLALLLPPSAYSTNSRRAFSASRAGTTSRPGL